MSCGCRKPRMAPSGEDFGHDVKSWVSSSNHSIADYRVKYWDEILSVATVLALQDPLLRPQSLKRHLSKGQSMWSSLVKPSEHPWHSQIPRLPRPSVAESFFRMLRSKKEAANPFQGSLISMRFRWLSHGGWKKHEKTPAPLGRWFIIPSLSHSLLCFTVAFFCCGDAWGSVVYQYGPVADCIMAAVLIDPALDRTSEAGWYRNFTLRAALGPRAWGLTPGELDWCLGTY